MTKTKIGEVHTTNEGYKITVIDSVNYQDCTVQFEDGTIVSNKQYGDIKKGQIKNPNHTSIFGVGFIGVGKYVISVNGKHTKAYKVWKSMLGRCYYDKFLSKYASYKDCSVTEDWHNFQNFAKWFEENYVEGYQLDKDILFKGNKIYSAEFCIFVPQQINSVFTKCDKSRGDLPIGVSKNGKNFSAKLNKDSGRVYLGSYKTPEEAFKVYKEEKEYHIKSLAVEYAKNNKISFEVFLAMMKYKVEITD